MEKLRGLKVPPRWQGVAVILQGVIAVSIKTVRNCIDQTNKVRSRKNIV